MLYVVILWWMLKCFISGFQGNITSDCRQLAPESWTIANWPNLLLQRTGAGWKRAQGSAGLPGPGAACGAPWRGLLGGAALPRALEQVHPASAMLSRQGKPPDPRAWLHEREKDCRETGNILTAAGNTKNCMQRTAATTYHTAGKLQRGQGPYPLAQLFAANRCGLKQWRCSEIQKKSIPSATSRIPSLWKTPYLCTSKGYALHHLTCKIKVKSFTFRNK